MTYEPAPTKFSISTRKIIRFLTFFVLALSLFSAISVISKETLPDYPLRDLLHDTFNVDRERSVPTLYSTWALQVCALLLAGIAYIVKLRKEKYLRHWQALSLIFFYLSLDEALSFHERFGAPVRKMLGADDALTSAWTIAASALLVIFLAAYFKFIFALPQKIRRLFITAGGIYVLGAIGVEIIGGKLISMGLPPSSLEYTIAATCEELCEMIGIVVFMYALMSYLKLKLAKVEFSLID